MPVTGLSGPITGDDVRNRPADRLIVRVTPAIPVIAPFTLLALASLHRLFVKIPRAADSNRIFRARLNPTTDRIIFRAERCDQSHRARGTLDFFVKMDGDFAAL